MVRERGGEQEDREERGHEWRPTDTVNRRGSLLGEGWRGVETDGCTRTPAMPSTTNSIFEAP